MNKLYFFEYDYYTTRYKDLSHMNKESAEKHFLKYGINEKRKFNKLLENFDYNYYITCYKDLSKLDYFQACTHYIKHGIKENRICSSSSKVITNITKYKDLNKINNDFIKDEINKLPEYFDYDSYITTYKNLNTIFYCCPSIYGTAKKYSEKLNSYININHDNNLIIFGLYKTRDIDFLKMNIISNKYKKYIIIFGGSDTWEKRGQVKNVFKMLKLINNNNDNIIYYSISNYINNDLINHNLNYIPFNLALNDTNLFKYEQYNYKSKIYVYDINTNETDVYNSHLINKIIKFFGEKLFIRASNIKIPYNEIKELYKKCFLCLRLTKHDGNANNVQEFGLLGIKCVHNSHFYNTIPFNENDMQDIINTINEQLKNKYKNNFITSEICKKNNLYCNLDNLFDKNIYPEVTIILWTFNDNKYDLISSLKSILFQHMVKTNVYVISYIGDKSQIYINKYYKDYINLKYITISCKENNYNDKINDLIKTGLQYIKTNYFSIISCNTICYTYKYYVELKNIINTDNDFIISNYDYIKDNNLAESSDNYKSSTFLFSEKILNDIKNFNDFNNINNYKKLLEEYKYKNIEISTCLNIT